MCKKPSLILLIVALLPLAGCGRSADDLMRQQIAQLNAYADALESGADQAEVKAIDQRMRETQEALDNLNLSDEKKKELAEKHGEELGKALGRVMKAGMKQMGGMMQGMTQGMMQGMQGDTPKLPEGFPKPPE